MDEERVIDIEVRLAHHEKALHELNEALTDQQRRLTRMERLCDTLVAKMRALSPAAPDGREDEAQ